LRTWDATSLSKRLTKQGEVQLLDEGGLIFVCLTTGGSPEPPENVFLTPGAKMGPLHFNGMLGY